MMWQDGVGGAILWSPIPSLGGFSGHLSPIWGDSSVGLSRPRVDPRRVLPQRRVDPAEHVPERVAAVCQQIPDPPPPLRQPVQHRFRPRPPPCPTRMRFHCVIILMAISHVEPVAKPCDCGRSGRSPLPFRPILAGFYEFGTHMLRLRKVSKRENLPLPCLLEISGRP